MSYNLLLNSTFAMRAMAVFAAARPDIIIGAAIWTLKQTCDGVYYLCFNSDNEDGKIELNKELLDKLLSVISLLFRVPEKLFVSADAYETKYPVPAVNVENPL